MLITSTGLPRAHLLEGLLELSNCGLTDGRMVLLQRRHGQRAILRDTTSPQQLSASVAQREMSDYLWVETKLVFFEYVQAVHLTIGE